MRINNIVGPTVHNRIPVETHPWMLVEMSTRVTEFEYYFACTRRSEGVHLYSIMSSGKMSFKLISYLTFIMIISVSITNAH